MAEKLPASYDGRRRPSTTWSKEDNLGIVLFSLEVLLREAKRFPFSGRCLSLGRQDVDLTAEQILLAADYMAASVTPPDEIGYSAKQHNRAQGFVSDDYLFACLGIEHHDVLDVSDYEQSNLVFDLNRDDLPGEWVGQYDLIVDSGTLEHVFHLPNALNNLHRLLKVGGRIIHIVPSSNHIDHGFYMFSPTLFLDFYETNRFEINLIQVLKYDSNHMAGSYAFFDYTAGCLDGYRAGGLDAAMYGVVCVVTKTSESTGDRVPQQGVWARTYWRNA
jgi:SAM-dependent methyltransferase